jgi:hypothetical protein
MAILLKLFPDYETYKSNYFKTLSQGQILLEVGLNYYKSSKMIYIVLILLVMQAILLVILKK